MKLFSTIAALALAAGACAEPHIATKDKCVHCVEAGARMHDASLALSTSLLLYSCVCVAAQPRRDRPQAVAGSPPHAGMRMHSTHAVDDACMHACTRATPLHATPRHATPPRLRAAFVRPFLCTVRCASHVIITSNDVEQVRADVDKRAWCPAWVRPPARQLRTSAGTTCWLAAAPPARACLPNSQYCDASCCRPCVSRAWRSAP